MKHTYAPGDLFLLPLAEDGAALCQVVSVFKDRFKKVFSFGVMQVHLNARDLELTERSYLQFTNSRGTEQVIFTSADKIRSGEWAVIGHLPLTPSKREFRYFRSAYHLYCDDAFLESLEKTRAKAFNVMAIAGFDLVQRYLQQMLQESQTASN